MYNIELFNNTVTQIILYGCKVWGYVKQSMGLRKHQYHQKENNLNF